MKTKISWLLGMALLLLLWLGGGGGAAQQGPLLEDLSYRVDAWILQDAARARLTLQQLGPGRYLAEVSGVAQGLAGVLTGRRRDKLQTEMVWEQGRLRPVIYREESRSRGKYLLKEYRFDYARRRLELWQHREGQGLQRKWDTTLEETIYDPLSAFYNFRLGFLGSRHEGETLRVSGIPYPRPEEIVIRLGPQTDQGRKVMVSINIRAYKDQQGEVFAFFDRDWGPTSGWTRLLQVGKISGELLPGSKFLGPVLPELRTQPGDGRREG
jgi:hypothetical protein